MNKIQKIKQICFIVLACQLMVQCSENMDVTNPQQVDQYIIRVVSGDNQSGKNDEVLSQPVVVKVMYADSTPLIDAEVSFEVIKGWGYVTREKDITDTEGLADVRWTLGPGPNNILKASFESQQTNINYSVDIYAQTELPFDTIWTSDLIFYDNFGTRLSHDNRILETSNVLTFSDASSEAVKTQYAYYAEQALAELKQLFDISSMDEFNYSPKDYTKIRIYSNRFLDQSQHAFRYGFILYAMDSPRRLALPEAKQNRYRLIVKHEMMHVVQWLFGLQHENSIILTHWTDVWFTEGIAVHVADGGSFDLITSMEGFDEWRQEKDHINPISIQANQNLPENAIMAEYYPMFGLAFRYLVDEKGLGKTYADVRAMFEDMLVSNDFRSSFKKHMGITLEYYEDNFFTLIPKIFEGTEINNYSLP